MIKNPRRGALFGLFCVTLVQCGDEPSEPTNVSPRLTVISGADVQDSAAAILPLPLVVEVRDTRGNALSGAVVHFERIRVDTGGAFAAIVLPPPNEFAAATDVTTDASGRASVRLQLGGNLGNAGIRVTVPSLGLADTARYTIVAGRPVHATLEPGDSGLFVGRSLTMRFQAFARFDHRVTGVPTYEVVEGPVTVSTSGVVTAIGIGVAQIRVRLDQVSETAKVTVVPNGALVVATQSSGVIIMNLDGSGMRQLHGNLGWYPTWSPSGDKVVYELNGRLAIQSVSGGAPTIYISPDTTKGAHSLPSFSRNGQYVYFTTSADGEPQEIWRANADVVK
jgi:hypothetical protein